MSSGWSLAWFAVLGLAACGGSTATQATVLVMPPNASAPEPTPSSAPPVVAADIDAAAPDPADDDAALLASIREISPTEHVVEARALAKFLEDDRAMREARMVPDPPGGTGISLYGIRQGTIADRLGFANGDRVVRLMGKPTSTVDEGRIAWTAMRSASVIVVDVERRGVHKRVVIRAE